MRVLIAFDKFKDALPASELCRISSAALAECQPEWTSAAIPLADGGDGFCRTLCELSSGEVRRLRVSGPLGDPVESEYAVVSVDKIHIDALAMMDLPLSVQTVAIIELAATSGIALVPSELRSPWNTTSYGLGEQIADAISAEADAIVVGLGGSATHDLALGALQALGFRFIGHDGQVLAATPIPARWPLIARIEAPDRSWPVVRLACDVDNPLVGSHGAAAIFGPQKGLAPEDFERLDQQTQRMAALLADCTHSSLKKMNLPGAGAAGGAAFGLMTGLEGKLTKGAPLVCAWSGMDDQLIKANLVITGEGSFDASSLNGKGPGYLLQRALELGKPVHVFAGRVDLSDEVPLPAQNLHAITPPGVALSEALPRSGENLAKAIKSVFSSYQIEAPPAQPKSRPVVPPPLLTKVDLEHEREQRLQLHSRIRRVKQLLRPLPRRATLHRYPFIKWFAHAARKKPYLWSFRFSEVNPAIYVGYLLAFSPLYGVQIPLALGLALLLKANLPILFALQWIANPVTALPIYFAGYHIGRLSLQLVGIDVPHMGRSQFGAIFTDLWNGEIRHSFAALARLLSITTLGGWMMGLFCAAVTSVVYRLGAREVARTYARLQELHLKREAAKAAQEAAEAENAGARRSN